MSWEFLSEKDAINVIWPCAAPRLKEGVTLQQFIEKLNAVVQSYGLAGITCHPEIVNPSCSFGHYYANNDQHRAQFLREALIDPSHKAIWVGRGGFGAIEIIQIFEQESFGLPKRIIPLIGFSDVTALHLFAAKYQWPTLHAPVANHNSEMHEMAIGKNNNTSIQLLIDILKGNVQELEYSLEVLNPDTLQHYPLKQPISTKVLGGNFSVIQRSIGTSTQLNAKDSVLFFEDTGENIVRLRSLLNGVACTGMFDQVTAIFFGDLPVTGGNLKDLLIDFSQVLKAVRKIHKPILLGRGFGHGAINQILPLGTLSSLEFISKEEATLKISTHKSAYS